MITLIRGLIESFSQPNVVSYGLVFTASQVLWEVAFRFVLPKGPWTKHPTYTAHQITTLPFMIYLSVVGFQNWHIQDNNDVCGENSALYPLEIGILMSQIIAGSMLLWDIPVSLLSKEVGDTLMLCHHVGMWMTAGGVLGLWSGGVPLVACYAPYFFGVIEFSSIPLLVIDLFDQHKHPAYHALLQTSNTLQALHGLCQGWFAVSFLVLRVYYFPKTVFGHVLPTLRQTATHEGDLPEGVTPSTLYNIVGLGILFTLLQCYWGYLLIVAILKTVGVLKDDDSNNDKDEPKKE